MSLSLDKNDIKQIIGNVSTKTDLENFRLQYLGKKGFLTQEMKSLSSLLIEEKKTKGLGVFKGNVKKFDKSSNSKVPFISWVKINLSEKNRTNAILQKCHSNEYYFLHSYFCDLDSDENVVAYSQYNNTEYPAIINKNKVFGVQFHPEKSRETGLQLLKNFSEIR